jgi:hypothetical protein
MVGELDFVLECGRGVTGVVQNGGVLRVTMKASICSE